MKKYTSLKHQLFLILGIILFNTAIYAQLVSGGTGHSMAVCADGSISAWGLNDQNELGQGSVSSTGCFCEWTAVAVPGITGVSKVGAGGSHTLILMNNGTIKAIGRNFDGELGNGMQTTSGCFCDLNTVNVNGMTDVIAVSAGNISSLALKSDGTVWGWGGDNFGQLGDGNANLTGCFCELAPVQAAGLNNIVAITNGSYHAMALKGDGTVWAWGNNSNGQLGIGNTNNTATPTQIAISDIIAIAAGQNHSYALKSDGTVWAWGDNSWGQLGTGTATNVPLQVQGLTNVIAIANGFNHSIALKNDGTVWTWGANYSGQLGNGSTNGNTTATVVPGLTDIVELGGSMGNFCLAIKSDGSVWSWGDNSWGSVGNGSITNALSPVLVQSLCAVPTSIASNNKQEFQIYPNPTIGSNFAIIMNATHGQVQIDIFNAIGEQVFQKKENFFNKTELSLPLSKGVYFVRVSSAQFQGTKKLIIE